MAFLSDGQRQGLSSVFTDCAFFATVAVLGLHKVLDGQAVVALLGFYGAGRVSVGMRKSEARSAYYEGAASTSSQMRAVREPIIDDNDDDDPGVPPKRASGTGTLIAPLAPPARPGRDPRRDPSDPPPPPRIRQARMEASPIIGMIRLLRGAVRA